MNTARCVPALPQAQNMAQWAVRSLPPELQVFADAERGADGRPTPLTATQLAAIPREVWSEREREGQPAAGARDETVRMCAVCHEDFGEGDGTSSASHSITPLRS